MRIAQRLDGVAPSATLALTQKARELKASGKDVVSLTAGEPDFPTAEPILRAAKQALDDGHTRYTAVAGIEPLRKAIQGQLETRGLSYTPKAILVSTGAKQSVFGAVMALLNPSDDAIVVAPYWLSYADMIRVAGGRVITVSTSETSGFVMNGDALENALTDQTRLLVLNSPSNPSGAVYSEDQLKELAEVLRKHPEVTIISDEIYDRFVYGSGAAPSILSVAPDLKDRVLIINGCSKTYAMTGLRIGWAVGPQPLISAMSKLQGQSTSNASAPMQYAALEAITGDQSVVTRMVEAFERRRNFVVGRLRAMPDVTCFEPGGAFYAFPNLSAYVGRNLPDGSRIDDASALAGYLLHEFALVVVPGRPFGAPNHIRISFATDMDTLTRGLDRLQKALSTLN